MMGRRGDCETPAVGSPSTMLMTTLNRVVGRSRLQMQPPDPPSLASHRGWPHVPVTLHSAQK